MELAEHAQSSYVNLQRPNEPIVSLFAQPSASSVCVCVCTPSMSPERALPQWSEVTKVRNIVVKELEAEPCRPALVPLHETEAATS